MLLVDSSVLIAAFRSNEDHHREALQIIQSAGKIILLDYVLSETATILKMREGYEIADTCLDFIQNNRDIELRQLTPGEIQKTVQYFRAHNNTLSFIDTALLITHQIHDIPLATFDADLAKALQS